ncbi:N-acetylmuramoyl-L-alanine amidase [Liquorilactobacillus oeni]|uniref:N-acetylmuramoyl-L-alanine amidase n=1 Tax=Liquorilactobacillus oeni DSM 19972 TaxID=1423777 RepID=A0A0R1M861_9LACO|nr:N-acetylmuramoyl-L-alanine amidase [Liquorilactobacillus oeni]KRL04300.1 N-acetylmuramoyl-L-alanine amidase [Liquorilactobacillus oeni DSM 19972]
MKNKKTEKQKNTLILTALIIVLSGILIFRTLNYFKQVTIETPTAAVKKGPGIEYAKLKTLKNGSRVTIIHSKYHWFYVKTNDNKFGWIPDWTLATKERNQISDLSDATIVLDPGHGGKDSGALSSKGKMEKTYTLRLAKKVAASLRRRGAKVYMTRTADKFVDLKPRAQLSNEVHADAFISFHFDSSPGQDDASGFTTYYYHKTTSLTLAKSINSQFTALGLENRGIDFGNFLVIRDNSFPSILLEMGYINSTRDFEQIRSTSYQNKVSADVVSGLKNYFAEQNSKTK